ncbi:uncharacterized protein TM35_000142360 [Trypanosoma theileri]|uniref:Transmembrane protein n=1 Tax=Trypanosoma theileri TaxID=67003 RepID=A0A1X0NWE8_9TRYP|nr:uncharacterized protein TM35_000142360 [Trypanosoma theileri]ORC89025.1 hypothetical protein TM35_000142360 [Trypanosoma theileri]
MVEIVSDDYFPPEEDDIDESLSSSSLGGEVETVSVGGKSQFFSWLFPTTYSRPFNLTTTVNETLLESVNAVRTLMESGNLEAACYLVEERQLDISLTAVNTTLLVSTTNILLNLLVAPVYAFVSSHLRGDLLTFPGVVTQTLYTSGSISINNSNNINNVNSVNNINNSGLLTYHNATTTTTTLTNSQASGAAVESPSLTLFWFGMSSTTDAWKGYAEMIMFLVCVGLFILLLLVRFRFAKYFRGIDMYTSQKHQSTHTAADADADAAAVVPPLHLGSKQSNNMEDSFLLTSQEGNEQHSVQQRLPLLLDNCDEDTCKSPPRLSFTM